MDRYIVQIGDPYDLSWWVFDTEKEEYISDMKGNILKNKVLAFESEEEAQELADKLNQQTKTASNLLYEIHVEERDADGNVIDSDLVASYHNRETALNEARETKVSYPNTVIETWDGDNLLETEVDF